MSAASFHFAGHWPAFEDNIASGHSFFIDGQKRQTAFALLKVFSAFYIEISHTFQTIRRRSRLMISDISRRFHCHGHYDY